MNRSLWVAVLFVVLAIVASSPVSAQMLPNLTEPLTASEAIAPWIPQWQAILDSLPPASNPYAPPIGPHRMLAAPRALQASPDGYETLDSIPPGALGNWIGDQSPYNPIITRSEVASPYDGSTALQQAAVGSSYRYCETRYLYRYFSVGECKAGSRISFYTQLVRRCDSCFYDAAGVMVWFFYRGQYLTRMHFASHGGIYNSNPNFPNVVTMPNGYSGVVDFPVDFLGPNQPFDQIAVGLVNYCCYGDNYTILDEIRIKSARDIEVKAVTTTPDTLHLYDSGTIVFRATTNKSTTVTFDVVDVSGTTRTVGAVPTNPVGTDEHSAEFTWNGTFSDGSQVTPGTCTVVARAGSSSKSATFQVVGPKVTSVTPYPGKLTLDMAGTGSGIVFVAATTAPLTVTFRVISPTGEVSVIGSKDSQQSTSGIVAKLSWWGVPKMPAGTYTIVAEAPGSSKSATFQVEVIKKSVVAFGSWMKDTKDPATVVPGDPEVMQCPSVSWEEANGQKQGYSNGLSLSDPVNIVSGDFFVPEVDLSLKSRYPLTLARIYHSLDPRVGLFGRGWSSPFTTRLEFLSDGDVVFVNSDGSHMLFRKQGDAFVGPETTDLRLAHNADTGLWELSHPHGMVWTYGMDGKVMRMAQSCCGRGVADAVDFEYDANGTLHRVANPMGQALVFTVNTDGRITQVTDSSNRVFAYTYDSSGNLLTVTDPLSRVTEYSYSDEGFLTKIVRPGSQITAITYADRRASVVTNADGTTNRFAWDLEHFKVFFTDSASVVHEYAFDSEWSLKSYGVQAAGVTKTFEHSGAAIKSFENTQGAKESFTYNSDGLIDSRTDAQGNTSHYEYHPQLHKLTRKTDALGRVWVYEWCARGNLVAETDPAGNRTSYRYDSHNNRTSRTDSIGRVTRYIYNITGDHLVQTVDALGGISSFSYDIRGNLVSSIDQLGRSTTFEHDALDRLTKTVYPDGRFVQIEYDDAGNVAVRRDQSGRETRHTYDSMGRLLTTIRPDGSVSTTAYDASGRKISETDALNRVTRFTNDAIGRLTQITHPDGATERMEYDTEGRMVARYNELGQKTSLEYDTTGRLLATVDPVGNRWEATYDTIGRKIADRDPLGRVTGRTYDVLDRATTITRPDGAQIHHAFDAVGNLLSTLDTMGNRWAWEYDALDRQVKSVRPDGASATVTFDAAGQVIAEVDVMGRMTRHSYDLGGRRVSVTDPLNQVYRSVFDQSGRLIAVTDPLGATSNTSYDIMDRVVSTTDPLGNVTRMEYDAAGRRVAVTDALNRRSITTYDLRDRVTSQVDPEGRAVRFSYDSAGHRVQLTDGANRIWRWEHDNLGRVVREIDPLGNAVYFSFDAVGNRTSKTNSRGQNIRFAFDTLDRLTRVEYPDGQVATFGYDLEGRELVRSGASASLVLTWDSVGNQTSATFGPWGKTWRYSFDLAGNRIQGNTPENELVRYGFDPLNRLVSLDAGRQNPVQYSFDAAGRLTWIRRPGVNTALSYDAKGQLLELRHERNHGSSRMLARRQYEYNAVGNRVSMVDEDGAATRYFFDNSDWLTGVIYPDRQTVSYSYNGAGDRLLETSETPTVIGHGRHAQVGTVTQRIPFGYDGGGRMVSRASDTFVYDLDGNLVEAVEGDDETRYAWTADNRMVRVEKDVDCRVHGHGHCRCSRQSVISEHYAYLPETWKRLSRTVSAAHEHGRANEPVTFVSVFDGDDESHEYVVKTPGRDECWKRDGDCRCRPHCPPKPAKLDLVREFVGGPFADDLELTRYHGRSLHHLKNGLGSTIALTNRGGNAVSRIGYDAFGNMRWPDRPNMGNKPCDERDLDDLLDRCDSGRSFGGPAFDEWRMGRHYAPALTPHLFQGRRWESLSGQYWHRNRFMNPKYGRFSSSDPLGYGGDGNLWVFAKNNPVRYVDQFGEAVETGWDIANVSMGTASLIANASVGNWWGVALDTCGLFYDSAATAIPGLPGGAAVTINLYRGSRIAIAMEQLAIRTKNIRYIVVKGIDEAHHMVPLTKWADELAALRRKMQQWGIGLDDAVNGVGLPKAFHQGIHSNAYLEKLRNLERLSPTKEALIQNLDNLAQELLRLSGKAR